MNDQRSLGKARYVSIFLGDAEGRIEEAPPSEVAPAQIRIGCWSQEHLLSGPLELSEDDLVNLLENAVRAGILSPNFVKNLSREFEI